MVLNFFDKFINNQFNEGKIETTYPNEKGNVMVCCPFPHTKSELNKNTWKEETTTFFEKVPSACINKDMGAFHCFVCDRHFNELGFAEALTGKEKHEIIEEHVVKENLKNNFSEWESGQHKMLLHDVDMINKLHELHISDAVINELKLGTIAKCLATPVFINGELVNVARYNIFKLPNLNKVMYNENSSVGDIVPFDIWKLNGNYTVICEGEKDMLVARSNGFNAITLTGGSQSNIKKEYLEYFKDRIVYIVYDNDEAGRKGSLKLYKELNSVCNVYVTDISSVCTEDKEDVSDFFNKYNKNANDFVELLSKHSRKLSDEELNKVEAKHTLNLTKLSDNVKNSKIRVPLRSSFQIIATHTDTYAVPEYAIFKVKETLSDELKKELESKTWFLKKSHASFLELMEGKVKNTDIPNILANLCFLDKKWSNLYKLEQGKLKSIYKCVVADEVSDKDEKANETTIDLYSFEPLDIGGVYDVSYTLYAHPRDGQKLIAVANEIKQNNYVFDKNNKDLTDSLELFKVKSSLNSKIEELYQSAKCHIAPYLNKHLWFLMDLVFNSPLDITYKKPIRGALDIFVLGDTRTGKSETSKALAELYSFGEIVSLKTATVTSLVGGTDERLKKTKLGVLPRHHKELVIMEEFSGAPVEFIKTLTEIRSSNIVKIYRIAGAIKSPCKLRMITLSNPLALDGNMLSLSSYPHGVEPLTELITSPEDIARYDAFMLVPRVEKLMNPFEAILNTSFKIDKKHYENKTRWIKSLGADNVIIPNELGSYIFNQALRLNEMFQCSFTVFGSETDKKIARMSAALACMVCSTTDYEHVIVTKEHIDCIVNFIISLYDNNIFKLKDFANEEKDYNIIKNEDTQLLNEMYPKNTILLDFLSRSSRIGRNELLIVSGLDRNDFSKIVNILVSRKFVKLDKDIIRPTLKFRETYKLINKSFNLYDTSNTKVNENMFNMSRGEIYE